MLCPALYGEDNEYKGCLNRELHLLSPYNLDFFLQKHLGRA